MFIDNTFINCMPDKDSNDLFSLNGFISNNSLNEFIKSIGGATVFASGMKAASGVLKSSSLPPVAKIGLILTTGAGGLLTYNSINRQATLETVKGTIKNSGVHVAVTFDPDRPEPNKVVAVEKGSLKQDDIINSPLEISEQELSLLFEILDNSFYLTLICLFINYIVLLQSILKYLSEFQIGWVHKLPLPEWLCTKIFNLLTKLIPY